MSRSEGKARTTGGRTYELPRSAKRSKVMQVEHQMATTSPLFREGTSDHVELSPVTSRRRSARLSAVWSSSSRSVKAEEEYRRPTDAKEAPPQPRSLDAALEGGTAMPPLATTRVQPQDPNPGESAIEAAVEPALFYAHVYTIARQIPRGKVTTYGHIARLAGHPRHSRMVGAALKGLGLGPMGEQGEDEDEDEGVPWQRVVGAGGNISERGDGGVGAARQATRLELEDVSVTESSPDLIGGRDGASLHAGRITKWRVSLAEYGWFPSAVMLDRER